MNTKKIVEKRLAFGMIILLLYMITYVVCRYFLGEYSIPEWTARHFLVIAAIVSSIPVCLGWIKFSLITYVGYLIGILTGETFGGFQSDIPPQFLHWGWLICIAVFLSSCVIGIVFELKKKSERIKIANYQF
jgi:hypothetical protein